MSTGNFHKLRPATDYAGRTERKCKECGQEKPLDEFAITTEFKDVRTPYRANTCRDCSAKPQRAPADQLVGRRFLYGDNESFVSGGRIVSSPGPGVYLVAFADRESEVLMRLEDMIGWEFLPEPTPTLAEISDVARDRHSSTRRVAAGGLRATESARPVSPPRRRSPPSDRYSARQGP